MEIKKIKILRIVFLILIGLFIIPLISATKNVDLSINKFSFSYEDLLQINLNISNEYSHEIDVEVRAILGSEDEDFIVRPVTKNIKIPALEEKEIELYSFGIDENFQKAYYHVEAEVYYGNLKIGSDSVNFRVIDVLKDFNLAIKVCKDSLCKEQSKMFIKNENIYLKYNTDVENPLIKSTLTYPNGDKKEITLPTSIKAEQIGTYELEVKASKEGYKTITQKEQFGIIEKQAEIKMVSFKEIKNYTLYIAVGLAILIIITVIITLRYYKHKKR